MTIEEELLLLVSNNLQVSGEIPAPRVKYLHSHRFTRGTPQITSAISTSHASPYNCISGASNGMPDGLQTWNNSESYTTMAQSTDPTPYSY